MARKTEMDKIIQTVNDPIDWFQASPPVKRFMEIQPVGQASASDALTENNEVEVTLDEENSPNRGSHSASHHTKDNHLKNDSTQNECKKTGKDPD